MTDYIQYFQESLGFASRQRFYGTILVISAIFIAGIVGAVRKLQRLSAAEHVADGSKDQSF